MNIFWIKTIFFKSRCFIFHSSDLKVVLHYVTYFNFTSPYLKYVPQARIFRCLHLKFVPQVRTSSLSLPASSSYFKHVPQDLLYFKFVPWLRNSKSYLKTVMAGPVCLNGLEWSYEILEWFNWQRTANRWCCAKRSITNCPDELPVRQGQANSLAQRVM